MKGDPTIGRPIHFLPPNELKKDDLLKYESLSERSSKTTQYVIVMGNIEYKTRHFFRVEPLEPGNFEVRLENYWKEGTLKTAKIWGCSVFIGPVKPMNIFE